MRHMRPRFQEPQPHEEPKPLNYCQDCGEGLYHDDQAYTIDQEVRCADCGLDNLVEQYRHRLDKEDYE